MKPRHACEFILLVGVGSAQMVGDVLGLAGLKGLAAATQVAPAMKVFTAHQGYETHAARFALHWRGADGAPASLTLEPSRYRRIQGPYNRRNVYGAALAYGPLLRHDPRLRPMQESVMRYAFCEPGPLHAELGLPAGARDLRVSVHPVRDDARRDLQLAWEAGCHD
ncbi:hypothetical protein [Pseudomarimonas salicorniae]|uniref:Uncharacterized protein n=1 Tax=Pseudomarimonas salicorniae TaxID=2933270 RepID=A0ABT0GL99_9GAMM|nr:hypothetical protein [Lysobacter sp. CAU 1642]MCK7595325.1 hypothetical protein [Lysobacter sp. CAU 1642]